MKFNNKNYLWNSVELEKIIDGNSSTYWECKGIEIDSRKIKKGDLFFPLPGENFDGHDFIKEAIARGAEATLIKEGSEVNNSEFNNVIVGDVLESLYRLAKESRIRAKKLYDTNFVAITGSSGKTSTKEIMKKACNSVATAYANPDSYNNQIGVPYSLVNIPRHTNCAILEIGMNNFDEIKKLSILIKPFISIITNISSAHIGKFNSIQDIVKAKSEIFYGMDKNGFAILNRDQKFYKLIKDIANKEGIKNIITFGESKNSDVCLRSRKIINFGQDLEASVFGKTYNFKINLDGVHQALNCLSVIAALKAMDYDIEKALTGLSNVELLTGRGIKHKIYINNQESCLIDDTYNANPSSVEASLRSLNELSRGNRNVLVIGDMRELGNFSKELHETIANLIIKLNTTLVFCVGSETQVIYKLIKNNSQAYWFKELSEMKKENYIDLLEPSDFILVKGSRAMKMEKLVNYTINSFKKKDL